MIDLNFALQPKQELCLEKMATTPVLLYGGAKGGGKSGGMRRLFLISLLERPHTRAAIFRKTYPELLGNHISKILEEYPALSKYYNDSKKILTLPNGSTLEFCYARNDKDLDNYQGREFELLGIDEAGQWSEGMFTKLRGSNRSSRPGCAPRCLLTANPGGVGHTWLKRLFVIRKFIGDERPQDYGFIQALVQDNQALMKNDPDYVYRLKAEKNEALRRAYLYGDWDIVAGAYFEELRKDVHLIKAFDIPKHWLRFGAYDYGYGHPAAFGWFCADEDGNVYMYRELVQAKMRVDQFAAKIKEIENPDNLQYIVAGLDCWVDKRSGMSSSSAPPTIAEEFQNQGIFLSKANVGRIQGAVQVRNYLAWQDLPQGRQLPRFRLFDTCPVTFECLSRMEHDPLRIEDVLKVDADNGDPNTGDDPYDMVRYFLMSRPAVTEVLVKHYKPGTAEYGREQVRIMEEQAMEQYRQSKNMDNGLAFPDDPWSKNPTQFDNDN